jgi:outer membrane receptor for ferrienterochelin and colicins
MMRVSLTLAMTLLTLATAAGPARAQAAPTPPGGDLSGKSLEALLDTPVDSVEGAARHTQRLTEAPASVTVLTSNDIQTFGWRTLADALRSVRGFHVTYDRNYSYVGVRAFGRPTDYNNRVLLLVDGHRVNDSIYDGALIGTEFPVDLALVDRIEVVRGPGSALYGTSAFFAVVNVVMKRGVHVDTSDVQVQAESLDTYKVRASHGWSDANRDLLLSVTRYTSKGHGTLFFPEFDAPETNHGLVNGNDGDEFTQFFASARVGNLQIRGVVGGREKRIPTGAWSTGFNDPNFYTGDVRGWGSATYTRAIGRASLTMGGYYDRYHYYGIYPSDANYQDGAKAQSVGGEAVVRWRSGRHQLTTGLEQRTNLQQDQWYGLPQAFDIDDQRSSHEVAAFAQDEIALTPRFTAVLGARYDYWSLKGGTGRPRLGLVYRTDNDTAIKALYGEAYRAPNLYELYYANVQVQQSVELKPEVARTTELVFERRVGRLVRATATGYYTHSSGLIDPAYTNDAGSFVYVNNESARSTGVEFEAESRWSWGLLVRGSLAVQRASAIETGGRLSNAPGELATVHVAVPFWRRQLVLASESLYTSDRTTVGGEMLPSYWLSNLTFTYRPVRMPLTVGASIYNAFDVQYGDPVGVEFRQTSIPQDGRAAALRVTLKF